MNQSSKVKSRISNPLSFLQTAYAASSGDVSQPFQKQSTLSRPLTTNMLAGANATKGNRGIGQSLASENPSYPTPPPTINVILFGEIDVSTSSVVNLIVRKEVASVSLDVNGCTMQSTRYDITFDNMNFAIFDTISLEEFQIGVNGYLKAIQNAYELISKLSVAGGIHLLLFCIRGSKITATTQRSYQLFHQFLCSTKVPLALVLTREEEDYTVMEDWWVRNQDYVRGYGIKSNGHACVTTTHGDAPGSDLKYVESQKSIRELLKRSALQNGAFSPEPHLWFARLAKGLLSFIEKSKSPKRRDIMRMLTNRCKLDTETARKIANMMVEGDADTKGDQVEQGKGGEGGSHSMEKEDKSGVANGNGVRDHTSVTPCGDGEAGPHRQVGRKDGGIPKVIGSDSQGWLDKMQILGVASMARPQETISEPHTTDSRQPSEHGTREHTLATWHHDGPDRVERKVEGKPRVIQSGSQDVGTIKKRKKRSGVTSGFGYRSSNEPERLGDASMDAKQYDDAVSYYSAALSLVRTSPQSILIKRSKAWLMTESWKQALDDANKVIALDPSSPWGYEIRHAVLHKAGDYDDAIEAFETMLSKMVESRDQDIQRHRDQYISPSRTREAIHKIVQGRLRRLPRVLINTITGRLHNRAEQASAFESLPIFKELISSMTTHIDYTRIKREVQQYFRYVMLSHKWEDNEPSFQQVVHMAVYDLDKSPTHDKLQTFCTIARDAGFQWAWSDTCCINKSDHFVLQEALVAMFRWYQDSAMMIVFLRGVRTLSPRGALAGNVWNTRGWTLQEYIAAKVVRFYTEDWTLYRDLDVPDHKECVEIISEMEQATGVSTQQLMALRPGLSSIWEKLRLASNRQTTLVEDAAYSLLGIFSAVGIPAIYGEGQASLGRLLANILTRSGDASILAWIGDSSTFNTCLPARLTVFDGSATSHIPVPQAIPDSGMKRFRVITRWWDSLWFDLNTALSLYDRLNGLPTPRFAESRLSLPCIAFQLPAFSSHRMDSDRVYRADTVPFGMVEVRTRTDLTRMKHLYLVHPWLDALLEHADTHGGALVEDDVAPQSSSNSDDEGVGEEQHDGDDDDPSPPPASPVELEPMDRETGARRLAARLRQPFGALLFQLTSTRGRAIEYRRVAADGMIMVRFRDEVSLGEILKNVRTIDVL